MDIVILILMKRSALSVLLLLVILISFSLYSVRNSLKINESREQLDHLRDQVGVFQEKLGEKQEELTYRQSSEFIYKEALEQLGFTNPGEVIPVLPDWKGKQEELASAETTSSSPTTAVAPLPYWKRWRILFFGN